MDSSGSTVYCEVIGKDTLILPCNSLGDDPIVQKGKIVAFTRYDDAAINRIWVSPLNEKGFKIPTSGWKKEIIKENTGDPVPNWDEYQEL